MSEVDRDHRILLLNARYGLLTADAIAVSLFAGLSEKAAERVITRLLSTGRLRSHPLIGRQCYYTLTSTAAQDLGLDGDRFVLPMGAQALIQNFAIMSFCLLTQPPQQRLLRAEFTSHFPGLVQPGILATAHRTRYYLDTSDKAEGRVRLSLLVPDLGSHPRRLLRKVRREVEKRSIANRQLSELIRSRLFSVTLLTAFPDKARQLEAALGKEAFHARTVVVPGLAELLLFIRKPNHDSKCATID